MRLIILTAALLLSSCSTLKNISKSNQYYRHEIGKSICTNSHLHIDQLTKDDVFHFHLEEYSLSTRNPVLKVDEKIDEYIDSIMFKENKIIPVLKGTKFTVEEVYSYNNITNAGYIIMASATALALGGKLVDISKLYNTYYPYSLNLKEVEYCK